MNKGFFSRFLIACTVFIGAPVYQHANAFPLPRHDIVEEALPYGFTAIGYDFEGIVALSNCSGAYVQYQNSLDDDKAMVLTNGHCLETGMPSPGTFVYGKASSRTFTLFNSQIQSVGRLKASRIIYSTMTGTDVTLYELTETFKEIRARTGMRPLVMMANRPNTNDPIQVLSGYWQRGYSCAIEKFVYELHEGGWVMNDSIRYSRPGCEVIGGTSGSPVILSGTRTVVGINNTGNMQGQRCTEDNPCEIDAQGQVTYQRGFSYGQQTHQIYTCLNANREVDLNIPGCKLFH